eukprot:SAG31_NODE_532_length_14374_cov_30.565254_6_plen_64_part_00
MLTAITTVAKYQSMKMVNGVHADTLYVLETNFGAAFVEFKSNQYDPIFLRDSRVGKMNDTARE